jgi:hypothetical protein
LKIKIRTIPSTALPWLISKMNILSKDEEFSKCSPKALIYYFAYTEDIGSASISVGALAFQSLVDRMPPSPHVVELDNVEAGTLICLKKENAICRVAATERGEISD